MESPNFFTSLLFIEIIGTILTFIYIVLLMREDIRCWIFGIIGSLVSIYIFININLYAEAGLYTYYVGMGIYGWILWHRKGSLRSVPAYEEDVTILDDIKEEQKDTFKITEIHWLYHIMIIALGIALANLLGFLLSEFTPAKKTFADSLSTVFAFIATYMQARKILSSWVYWVFVNAFSVWLYTSTGVFIYGGLMVVYTILSVVGFINWRKKVFLMEN